MLEPGDRDNKALILWDGDCGFCRRIIAWVRRKDTRSLFVDMPYQQADISPEMKRACERAVHVITPEGNILRAGRASIYVHERLGWGWFARLLSFPPLIWIVEFGYRLVADHRDFFGRFMFREPQPKSDHSG